MSKKQQLNTASSKKLLDILKCLHCNYRTARKNSTTNLLKDDGTLELALQHNQRLCLLNLDMIPKLPSEGHPSMHWLLEGIYSVVHDKIRTFARYTRKIFLHARVVVLLCACYTRVWQH